MIVYKLFRVMKNGSIASLFINKKARYNIGEWMTAENHPTPGYGKRMGWHSCASPHAPHLSDKNRKWFKCEIDCYTTITRPKSQGNVWYISNKLKIIEKL
jgi:hypothetical protein